jgi:phenylpyruvate tautomerase PptA (4-oxalocrotonate tautomerase family)
MTLVRIDAIEGRRSPVQLEILADTVHSTIVEVFGAAETERYQIITEHRPGRIITFESDLGEGRTDDVVIIQIVQSAQTETQKRALYRELAERLYDRLSLREDDLIVTIVENTHADWSFTDELACGPDGTLWR